MQSSEGVRQLPMGRHFAVDEQGVGLRATWRLEQGFVNLSLWRNNRCTETFHLTPAEAGRLINFLVRGLADAASATTGSRHLRAVQPLPTPAIRSLALDVLRRNAADARSAAAEALNQIAQRIRP